MNYPLIVAHRGYPSKAIENTIESFQVAFEKGADFVEGDFWLSADDEIICIHDEDLVKVTNKESSLNVKSSNLAAIKAVNYLEKNFNQKLIPPTLEEVLLIIPSGKGLFIEIKDTRLKFVDILKSKIKKMNFSAERLRIISYHSHILKYSKSILPEIKTYLIFDWFLTREKCKNKVVFTRFLQMLNEINCDGIDLCFSQSINMEFVSKVKNAGFEIGFYDVNDEKQLQKVIDLNVNFITTDFPDLAYEILCKFRQSEI